MGVFVCRTILSFTVDSRSRSLTLSLHFGTKYSTQPVTSPCILHDSANDILPMLQQHNAADIDVAYRKSVFRLLNGPALFGRASDLEYPRPTSWNALRQHPDEALVDEFKSVLPCALRPFPQLRCILSRTRVSIRSLVPYTMASHRVHHPSPNPPFVCHPVSLLNASARLPCLPHVSR